MPLSATEDMVIGSIDIRRALTDGIKALDPGILARANRNILYIDEVNLLDDHLINLLLDAAAMGVNIVEREGISLYHPARFMLVGTMNPEEGSLRPQILDRFGLCVDVSALVAKDERLEIIRRRKDFDRDCWVFEERFAEAQKQLRSDIVRAQHLLPQVAVSDAMLEGIVDIITGLGIRTHRADIVMEKTACVLAALDGRAEVIDNDLIEAAMMALPHRMRQQPFEKSMPLEREQVQQHLLPHEQEDIEKVERTGRVKKNCIDPGAVVSARSGPARRTCAERGRYVTARPAEQPASIAVGATLRAAARDGNALTVLPRHLMEKVRVSRGDALYIIVLDCSSSMRMDRKIRLAKTLSWQLLQQTYEQRGRLAVIMCRGDAPSIAVAPTRDHVRVDEVLDTLPTGGKTPLTPALLQALELAGREREAAATVIVISDGRGNVFAGAGLAEDLHTIRQARDRAQIVCISAEPRTRSTGALEQLAEACAAAHVYIEDLL
jgi:magnesium chelatase subunit D